MKRISLLFFVLLLTICLSLTFVSCDNPMDKWYSTGIEGSETNNNSKKEVVEYTVTFDTDGGSIVESVTVKEGEKLIEMPNDPVKDGCYFIGWALDPKGNTPFNIDTAIYDDITIYAVWEEIE